MSARGEAAGAGAGRGLAAWVPLGVALVGIAVLWASPGFGAAGRTAGLVLVWMGLWGANTRLATLEVAPAWARLRRFAVAAIFGLTLLTLWEAAVTVFAVPSVILPAPSVIGARFVTALPHTAAMVLTELGLTLFLAYAGTRAGSQIAQAFTSGEWWRILVLGAVVTAFSGASAYVLMRFVLGLGGTRLSGVLAGMQTPPALLALEAAQAGMLQLGARGYLEGAEAFRRLREAQFVAIVTPSVKHITTELARGV